MKSDMLHLKTNELQLICKSCGIPFNLYYIRKGKTIKSSYVEPKLKLIRRIERYLKKSVIDEPTVITENLVKFEPIPNKLSKDDHIYFGQYKNGSNAIFNLMNELTDSKFIFGALSCSLIREYLQKENS